MADDGNGRKTALTFHHPPRRVVSLVPSMTESMFELGFGETVVGITDYCTHPAAALADLPRVGGPKNPRLSEIIALKPELVLANWEENTRQSVEALEDAGVFVWVTFPKSVRNALDVLWTLVGLYSSRPAAIRLEVLEMSLDWARNSAMERQPTRYFCPVWYDKTSTGIPWWMTFNADTYAHDLLSVMGGENIFAGRLRRYPLEADLGQEQEQEAGERDLRYPRVAVQEIIHANPLVILLPDEPFAFSEAQRVELVQLLAETEAVREGRVYPVDGSLITWHGSRLAYALRELPDLFTTGQSRRETKPNNG